MTAAKPNLDWRGPVLSLAVAVLWMTALYLLDSGRMQERIAALERKVAFWEGVAEKYLGMEVAK